MGSLVNVIDLLAELFIWIGLIIGGTCFLMLLIVRAANGSWVETEAVVVDGVENSEVRWMTTEGRLHVRVLAPHERSAIADPDQLHIHYSRRATHRIRFEASGHAEKLLRALGFIFIGIAILSAIVSVVALFVPQ